MNPGATILVSIATALTTSIITFLLYTPKLKADLQKEIKSRFNEQKWQTYSQFAELIPEILKHEAANISPFETEALKTQLTKIWGQVAMTGAPQVMAAWNEWASHCLHLRRQREEPDVEAFSKLLFEMKKDLGWRLEAKDILDALFFLLDQITKSAVK